MPLPKQTVNKLCNKGFTLIELMVVLAIIGIGGTMLYKTFMMSPNTHFCIKGYSFVQGSYGSVTQILDNNGKGIPCEVR